MKIQSDFSGIKRSFVDDIRGKVTSKYRETLTKEIRYPNGYVKVCASWMKRLWADEEAKLQVLSEQTEMFDRCGVYNGEDPDGDKFEVIPNKGHPFAKENWSTALDFMEWFKV